MKRFIGYVYHRLISIGLATYWVLHRYRIFRVRDSVAQGRHDEIVKKIFYEAGYFDSPNEELSPEKPGTMYTNFLAIYRGGSVGAISVVESDDRLPVQEFFNFQLPSDVKISEVAEITRFVIESKFRVPPNVVSVGLMNSALLYSRKRKTRWWIWCGSSYHLLGLQSFFSKSIILKQLPLEPQHIAKRVGREAYFENSRSIRVVLIDLESIDLLRGTRGFLWKIWLRIWYVIFRRKRILKK